MTAPTESVSFTLDVLAKPWQRAQHKGKQYFTPAESRAFKALVRDTFALRCGRGWRLDGMYRLGITANLPDWHTRDWDNIGKNIGDALNGVAWHDDNQVVDGHVLKCVIGVVSVSIEVLRIGDWPVKRKAVPTLPILERVHPRDPLAPRPATPTPAELRAMYPRKRKAVR